MLYCGPIPQIGCLRTDVIFIVKFNFCNLQNVLHIAYLRSADKVGRPFCFCSVSYYFFIILSYFSLPPTCVMRFLLYFLTNLNEI